MSVAIEGETDIILARQRTRQLASLIGFDSQDQTRITTAVSEIVRNALEYGGGGRIEYRITGNHPAQHFEIMVRDKGPGISDPQSILAGRHQSANGMGIGVVGARRLMDDFELQTVAGKGTTVRMVKNLPKRARAIRQIELRAIAQKLAQSESINPLAEVRSQNREMIVQLQELNARQEELTQLNQELQDTNRGVVALYAELEDRADHLRRADQLKSRFLSNMSHEFRTPLNSILSLSRLLLMRTDGELGAEQEKQVHFIRKSAEALTELVDNLLDIARVEAGKTIVTAKPFGVSDLFSTLRGMLRPLLVGDTLDLTFDEPADIPEINSDEGKVSQILRNFISNALKFTERGEVRVWAETDRPTDTVTFKVRDTGVGIAPTDIDLIWEEFTQVQNRLQGRAKGSGLGLPLSKKLAELLGGRVAVESTPGQGAVFSLTIPRFFPRSGERSESPDMRIEPGRLPILVLEDNAADAFSLDRVLAYSRYQPLHARSVGEAGRLLEQLSPAALVLDVLLEGEESWGFLLAVRQNEKTREIPAIVVSVTEDERKALSLGADAYLSKPVEPARLIALLDRLTGHASVTRVLLVDDEEISRYLVRQFLPRGGYDIQEAANALDGLEQAKHDRPDVILLDLNMDGVSGYEFLDRLAREVSPAPPAIVVTSTVLDQNQRNRLSKASAIVSKFDITAETLIAAIHQAVEARDVHA